MGRHNRPRVGRQSFTPENMRNPLFEEYYKTLGIVSANEWDAFMAILQKELPITFRVTGFREQNKELLRLIKNRFASKITKENSHSYPMLDSNSLTEGSNSAPTVLFHNLSWYPGEMAWQLDASRYTVRKNKELKHLHQFLVSEMESGNISRQEAVSMLPPLLLDVHAQHAVLDLCASPGSKSAQLVELLHASAEDICDADDDEASKKYAEPSGVVIANDLDQKRCYMMVHQVKRLQSPCALVTNEDATCFPRLYLRSEAHGNELLFDRVLADVPCSGDGTLRKNPDVWLRWTPNQGISNHNLQQRILRRAVELLRDLDAPRDTETTTSEPARVAYSTCSLNPVENEAVVASILEASQGALRLVDTSRLPAFLDCYSTSTASCDDDDNAVPVGRFRVRPGLTTWRVMTNKAQWFDSFSQVPSSMSGNIRPSMFPPTSTSELNLHRCLRVVPHDQNTGGFFIAILEKVSRLPWMKSARQKHTQDSTVESVDVPAELSTNSSVSSTKRPITDTVAAAAAAVPLVDCKRPRMKQENPFTYVDPTSDADWPTIRDYYGMIEQTEDVAPSQQQSNKGRSALPFCPAQLLYRSMADDPRRRQFYYTNRLVKDVVLAMVSRGVKLINTGVRMFSLMEDKQFTGYRLLQDGVELADAFIQANGGRRLRLPASREGYDDLVLLLREEMPLVSRMSTATQVQWKAMEPGPVLVEFVPPVWQEKDLDRDESLEDMPKCCFAFAGWRGNKSLRHYVGRHERLHLMRLANLTPEPAIAGRTSLQSPRKYGDDDSDSPRLQKSEVD